MSKNTINQSGKFIRELPKYYQEMYVDVSDEAFETVKGLIEDWGLCYCGEPDIDERQITEFMKRRKIDNEKTAERMLYKQGRIDLREPVFQEMRRKKVSRMDSNVRLACEILYRACFIEFAI